MRGHPTPHNARQGLHKLRRAIFIWLLRISKFARLALCLRYAPAFESALFLSFGGFCSCLFLFLFVVLSLSVLVLLACPFLSVALSVWRWLVAAVPGLCVLLLVRSLARWCVLCSCLVLLLLSLPCLVLVWLAFLWLFVLGYSRHTCKLGHDVKFCKIQG